MPGPSKSPTHLTASDHEHAFDFFNARLFGASLPKCVITLSSKRNKVGYFRAAFFTNDEESGRRSDEIALNPEYYGQLPDYLSTLVHEMVHLEQQHQGKPGKDGYHNRAWAERMIELGLPPFNVTHPQETTGLRMSHTIRDGGPFDLACKELLRSDFRLRWVHRPAPLREDGETDEDEKRVLERRKKKIASKTLFMCPQCTQSAWAKPSARLKCGSCNLVLVTQEVQIDPTAPEGNLQEG